MKKVLALVLAVVMVCTIALAAVPIWTPGTGYGTIDAFNKYSNQCVATGTEIEFHPAVAPEVKDGKVTKLGNIAYYTVKNVGDESNDTKLTKDGMLKTGVNYILVNKYEKDVTVAIKSHSNTVKFGDQTTPDALYFLMAVDVVYYEYTGTLFTAWGTGCGQYKAPADAAKVKYFTYTVDGKTDVVAPGKTVEDTLPQDASVNYLVDGRVYTAGTLQKKTEHNWVANTWDATGKALTYKCTKCGVIGTAVESAYLAPAGAALDQLAQNLYVYYTPVTTGTGTTNPPTGANDVIGVAAALAVVALVSGAAISLKK